MKNKVTYKNFMKKLLGYEMEFISVNYFPEDEKFDEKYDNIINQDEVYILLTETGNPMKITNFMKKNGFSDSDIELFKQSNLQDRVIDNIKVNVEWYPNKDQCKEALNEYDEDKLNGYCYCVTNINKLRDFINSTIC